MCNFPFVLPMVLFGCLLTEGALSSGKESDSSAVKRRKAWTPLTGRRAKKVASRQFGEGRSRGLVDAQIGVVPNAHIVPRRLSADVAAFRAGAKEFGECHSNGNRETETAGSGGGQEQVGAGVEGQNGGIGPDPAQKGLEQAEGEGVEKAPQVPDQDLAIENKESGEKVRNAVEAHHDHDRPSKTESGEMDEIKTGRRELEQIAGGNAAEGDGEGLRISRGLCSASALGALGRRAPGVGGDQWGRTWLGAAVRLGLRSFLCERVQGADDSRGNGPDWGRVFRRRRAGPKGSQSTSADSAQHELSGTDIHFRVLAADKFVRLWSLFNTCATSLLVSLTQSPLKGFENPADGGSTFYLSEDGKFLLKSVDSVERAFFAPQNAREDSWSEELGRFKGGFRDYCEYFGTGQNAHQSLLPKMHMLLQIQEVDPVSGNPVGADRLFLVSNGLFPRSLPAIHYKFDLKGAVLKRRASEEELGKALPTLRELDLVAYLPPENMLDRDSWLDFLRSNGLGEDKTRGLMPKGIRLDGGTFARLMRALERDTQFLRGHNVMDYSLLLGVHFVRPGEGTAPDLCSRFGGFPLCLAASCSHCTSPQQQREGPGEHSLLLFPGIIDILQPYTEKRRMEELVLNSGLTRDVIREMTRLYAFPEQKYAEENAHALNCVILPDHYRRRFMDYLSRIVFKRV